MLDIVRAIKRFHNYLYGAQFTIVTDCNALVYAVNKANLNPKITRWTLSLQNYKFKIIHRTTYDSRWRSQIIFVEYLQLKRELKCKQLNNLKLKALT